MWQKKIEVIISKSKIIFDAVENNLPSIEHVQTIFFNKNNYDALIEFPKINNLIVDENIFPAIPLYNVKSVINLTDSRLTDADIFLKKPLKLTELLQIIKINRAKNQIFCRFNHNWIYDEQTCKLFNQSSLIRLTEKENEVFKHLLLSKDYKMTKEELFQNVWQYHPDSNSTTFETHMSRLKQKLPQDLFRQKSNYYRLTITDIV